ncbi:hypothetical protein RclHR1_17330001 [Rhizophagus clarus]|uniref:BTB domain-containing protein n=1 Tax=Rhizophagus clarus TaxID=94130 RepID=A0A2Z6QNU6_9GLOM|nr:hypothetical protein RclHR1_17330001 [Rhizophagus clarus]GES75935.1 hypothetical protein GLOIN_2v1636839 [Rhizophagus clarus]
MALKFHSVLSKDFSLTLNNYSIDDHNVIIQVGKNQNKKEFRAHSYILRSRSPYFKNAFLRNEFQTTFIASEGGWIINNNVMKFKKPNINPPVFEMVLKYMYTGEVDLTNQSGLNVLEFLVASDEFLLEELFERVQDYLIKEREKWIQESFVLVLRIVSKLDSCKKLQDHCLESICANPLPSFTSNTFISLDEVSLYNLLKRNDLLIDEIDAWDFLIKWGINRTSGLGSVRTNWNYENYKELKKTLNRFIPLIRFVEISSKDYFDKIRPYKVIIPDHMCEEIEKFYFKGILPKNTTLPPRTGTIKSNIIKQRQFIIIKNWIDKKDSYYNRSKKDNFYNFKLIYRKSRDGNNIVRNKCIGQGAVLILIKTKFSEKIFGGYNPIGWNDNSNNGYFFRNYKKYLSTTDSFIFSFTNNNDKISRVINSEYAIYDYSGMNGVNFGGGVLVLENDCLTLSRSGGNYENLRSGLEFFLLDDSYRKEYGVQEIEVFSVKKTN